MRATWRLLNGIINKRKKKVTSNTTFKVENREMSDPLAIANKFCQYFSNMEPNLGRRIRSNTFHRNFLSGTFNQFIFLDLATEEEIIAIANQFQSGKAAGSDNIPMSIIKQSRNIISAYTYN